MNFMVKVEFKVDVAKIVYAILAAYLALN